MRAALVVTARKVSTMRSIFLFVCCNSEGESRSADAARFSSISITGVGPQAKLRVLIPLVRSNLGEFG